MSTPKWAAGTLYLPGDLVQPVKALPPSSTQVTNGGFESGATGWDFTGGCAYKATDGYGGGACCEVAGSAATGEALNETELIVPVGKSLTARCMIRQGASDVDHTRGWAFIRWFDSSDTQIGDDALGNIVNDGRNGAWHQSTVTAVAPDGTAYARVGIGLYQNSNDDVRGDSLSVTGAYAGLPEGLIFKAVQEGPGTSGNVEPAWPSVLGQQVTDNTVTWEAVQASRVVWTASPILKSGSTEPTFPTQVGGFVPDNTINWECVSRRIEDENCPHTKVVIITASKVFAADDDIICFCATANPLDWTSEQDAGYLPSGLQSANANDMAVMGQYRGNLVAFNASSFQNWQVDPDPAAMALLDQMEGIGSTWHKAAQAVGNELLFLSQRGVRSVGIAAGAENLSAGDVGEPVDELVQAAVAFIGASGRAVATYYPGAGQYWLAFPYAGAGESWVYVYTMSGRKGKWSRYYYPFVIECFTQLGDDLYIRHGDIISKVDPDALTDEIDGVATNFTGTVWWPWLDFGQPGVTKMLEGIDYIGSGQGPSIQIGYDQRNVAALTTAYQLDNDTLPGGIIPIPVMGPTFSVKLNFAGGAAWTVNAVNLLLMDQGNGP